MTQPKQGRGRPATGKTPAHSVRCPDEVWNVARDKAKERGETIAKVIEAALRRYIQQRD